MNIWRHCPAFADYLDHSQLFPRIAFAIVSFVIESKINPIRYIRIRIEGERAILIYLDLSIIGVK